jgi:pimeloyl-ACP methyl ester carboxylesterase
VAGLVLVDGYYEAFDRGLGQERLQRFLRGRATQYRLMDTLGRLGLPNIFSSQMIELLGPDFRNMPQQERKRYVLMATRPNALAITIDEQAQAVAALANNPPIILPHDLPLRILMHGVPWPSQEDERIWQETQRHAATWSTHSKVILAEKSGHTIMLSQPDLIIEAIREVIGVAGLAS